MTLFQKSIFSLLAAFSFTIAATELSAAPITAKPTASEEIAAKSQEVKDLQGEISFTQQRRKRSQKKLQDYEQDIVQKNNQLKMLQKKFADSPSLENEQLMRNEQQRIALAELSMKSRVAEVVRLEGKEMDLTARLEALVADIERKSPSVHSATAANSQLPLVKPDVNINGDAVVMHNMTAQVETLTRRLQVLQRENERLRQVTLVETQKREEAEMRVILLEKRLAELDAITAHPVLKKNDEDGINLNSVATH